MALRFRPFEWLWLGSERKRAREHRPWSERSRELARRAELAAELGGRARRPAEPLVHGPGDALACALYVEAVYWALAAQVSIAAEASAERAPDGERPELSELWAKAHREQLERAAGGAEALERLRSDAIGKSFVDFGELDQPRQFELAARLAAFVDELTSPLRSERTRAARIRMLRLVRIGSVALVFTIMLIGILKGLAWNEQRRDLARRATWKASSTYLVGGCVSPAQSCPEGPSYFFHTLQESNPSIMFDLGNERGFSKIVVENRVDCCTERAIPLVVEVSNDGRKWKQVARRNETFTSWQAKFPRVRARYVKLSVPTFAILHLSRVRILP